MVLGELELAWRLIPNEFVAVTGTNGKTTTTEWIGHVHREAGLPVAVAGNVGTAVSTLAVGDSLPVDATVVCEASLFQLEDTLAFSPEAAVLLNLSPDHLDRHGTYDAYVAAKLKIFVNQGNYDLAVAPADLEVDDLGGCARRVTFGSEYETHPPTPIHFRTCPRAPVICGGGREVLVEVEEHRAARSTRHSRMRWPRPRCAWPAGSTATSVRSRLRDVRRRSATGSSESPTRRSDMDQRLQGDQRGEHDRRAAGFLWTASHLIAGGPRQAAGLLAPGRAGVPSAAEPCT